jgi:hypothetical protein
VARGDGPRLRLLLTSVFPSTAMPPPQASGPTATREQSPPSPNGRYHPHHHHPKHHPPTQPDYLISTPNRSTNPRVTLSCISFVSTFVNVLSKLR